jgi:DNA-binding transcriptional LysR family regulator
MNIDTSCFKAFMAASQVLNFTEASRLIGMTQSGVSQHVAKLEKDVGAELFLRVGKKVILTEAGKKLHSFIESYGDQVLRLKDSIQSNLSELEGKVSYAMPASCLLSPHFQLFLQYKKNHFPKVDLSVEISSNDEILKKILHAEIDFGFVTKKSLNEEIDFREFCQEEFVLVSALKNNIPVFEANWISYPGSDVLHEVWMKHTNRKFKNALTSKTNSLEAAFTMIANDLGVMVVPRHCVEASGLSSKIKIHEILKKPCMNTIYIAGLKSAGKPRRVEKVIETFFEIGQKK